MIAQFLAIDHPQIVDLLVIGDRDDEVVGPGSSEEFAERLPNGELDLTTGRGHAAFEEREFNQQVLRFLTG